MKETQYVKGTRDLRDDILDFGNYVFSQAHAPHDFRRLLPKVYGAHIEGMENIHFLALQEGFGIHVGRSWRTLPFGA